MEDNQWHDPLLLTDVSRQQHTSSEFHHISSTNIASQSLEMRNLEEVQQSLEIISPQRFSNVTTGNTMTNSGGSMLGFSLTSPDLVVCAGSPDIPKQTTVETASHKERAPSIVLSLEEGINGVETEVSRETSSNSSKFSSFWQSSSKEADRLKEESSSFELASKVTQEGNSLEKWVPIISINAGSEDKEVALGETIFLEDNCFNGGDVLSTVADVGDDVEISSLYQTARFGDFSYNFRRLEPGKYIVDLHFAEIVFKDGPPGMRVFDVFIQDEKVVSGLDIYARVGANKPLVIGNLEASVKDDAGLSIRLKGVIGNPIMSGILVRKDVSVSCVKEKSFVVMGATQSTNSERSKDTYETEVRGDFNLLHRNYEVQKQELAEAMKAIEELKRENQMRNKECQEALKSLHELQNELMRKSMHVGSLAFAVEGQVKEKSKWFSSLRDLKMKLKMLKLEHIKLSEEALKYKECLTEMDEMRSAIKATMTKQAAFNNELINKITEGEKERKELSNKVLELKGNIRVFCRCRPLNVDEISTGAKMAIDFECAREGELTIRSNGWPKKTFKFDAVFGPQANQADVFEDTAPFATSVLDGYNVCIFAYGQTGTGKTFTMEGTEDARGVNYRTLAELFNIISERQMLYRYEICVSVLEVYNEQIRDLLASGTQPGVASKRLEIRKANEGMLHVPGLVEARVSNMNEVWDVLQTGSNARTVGSTNANEYSSRSHCIHCVMVKGENLMNGEFTKSKLWLVDLAGSERIAKTEAQGERLKEAQNINRSLSALGDVISALANKSPHIPYRNSKLTHLLQDSLGGDSKALMFVQISPSENDLSETLCSLNFASRVKGVELGPGKRQLDSSEFLRYKQLVEKTKQETKMKDLLLRNMEETIHNLEMKAKEKDQKNKNLQEKLKELEAQLLVERKLARQHVDTKIAEQQQHQMRQQLEDQHNIASSLRPPLAAKPLGNLNNTNDELTTNYNTHKTTSSFLVSDGFVRQHNDPLEKENSHEIAELLLQPTPRKTGRASLCPTAAAQRIIPLTSTPRRNSLIPLATTPMPAQLPSLISPLPPPLEDKKLEERDGAEPKCLVQPSACSPRAAAATNKLSSGVLRRRSLTKRIKSPLLQQQLRRGGGVNVGMEKVRVSIGSRGKILGNTRRVAAREAQQKKQSQREKERGWNF